MRRYYIFALLLLSLCSYSQGLIFDSEWYTEFEDSTFRTPYEMELKDFHSLKDYATAIGNQLDNRTCVPFSIAHAYTIRHNFLYKSFTRFSASFIANQITDCCEKGTSFKIAFGVIKKTGICPIEQFKNYPNCKVKPNKTLFAESEEFAIKLYSKSSYPIDIILKAIKEELQTNYPVIAGITYTPNLLTCKSSFWIPKGDLVTRKNEEGASEDDGHAIVIIGFNEKEKYFEILNSYGAHWGQGGFVKIKYQDLRKHLQQALVIKLEKVY